MRNFITIVENTLQRKGDTRPTATRVSDDTFSVAPAIDTDNAIVAGSQGFADTELGQRASDLAPSIMRDLDAMVANNPDLVDDGLDMPAQGRAEPIPRNPENLPMVLSQELDAQGAFEPKWHQVRNLPGMASQAIRMVGRQIFGNFTDLPLEEVQMMTTAFNINPEVDVRKMFSLIKENGVKQDQMNYDFSEMMPGYAELAGETDAQLWRALGYEFLLMRDNGGHYVYAWPETASKLTSQGDPLQLS